MNKTITLPELNPTGQLAQQLKLITFSSEYDYLLAQDAQKTTTNDMEKVLNTFLDNFGVVLSNAVYFEHLTVLAFLVITQSNNDNINTKYTTQLIKKIQQDDNNNLPYQKISFLIYGYNQAPITSALRYDFFVALAQLILSLQGTEAVLSQFDNIDAVLQSLTAANVAQWKKSDTEIADIFKKAYDISIYVNNQTAFSARALLSTALSFATKANEENPLDSDAADLALTIAKELVILALALPSKDVCLDQYLGYDVLLQNNVINTVLKQEAAGLYELLNNFANAPVQNIDPYVATSEYAALCAEFNLDTEVIRTNLIALAVADVLQLGKTYSYAQLSSLFNTTDENDIDEYLVEASAHGQITAKINALEKTVFVSRCIPRKFVKDQALQVVAQRFKQWKHAIDTANNVSQQQ